VAERRLRLVLGMPINSAELIRPADEPTVAPLQFDWDLCAEEALSLRPELRRQQWVIKQRELELLANKNYLMPQLDAIARYRWRGFGHDLVSQSHAQFSSAWGDLADSDFQEWQLGIEYAMPLGFRHAHAAVRNSELQLARERAVLAEQRRQVIYGLSNAFGELRRAFSVVRAEYNRREAANDQLNSVQAAFAGGFAPFDLVLEAQRRVVDTEIQYHQAKVEYALAVKNIHFEKGSILEYANVSLAEGPSVPEAYADAARRAARRGRVLDYVCRDAVISQGATRRSAIADVGPTVIKSGIYEPMSIPRTDIPPAESLEPVDAPHRD
jgi:outer membrane protein TolC